MIGNGMPECGAQDSSVIDHALRYAAAGLSVLPIECDGTKKPPLGQVWKHLQARIATEPEIHRVFRGLKGIAVIGGAVSGNLETLDIDDPALVEPFESAVREIAPGLLERLPTVATPRNNWGGRHYRYRIEGTVAGNTKLAQSELRPQFNPDGSPLFDLKAGKQRLAPETLIETRGEGGYAIVPGSPPECHDTGLPYKHVAGPPLTEVPTISAEDHRILWHVAKSFNRYVDQREVKDAPASQNGGDSPGDAFNARASWQDILVPAGWAVDRTSGELTFWRRPGKSKGISATTGVKSSTGTELLCVFSTNAFPFEGPANGRNCTSYSKFAAYAVLNHGGDFSTAASALAAQGYGDKPKKSPAKPAQKLVLPEPFRPFPTRVLPEPLRGFIEAGAKAIGCDTSFIALPLLTVVGAAIGNSRRLLAKRGWAIPPILWTAIVGESGTAKTPAYRLAVKAIRERQRKALQRQEEEEERYQSELEIYEKRFAEWKRDKQNKEEAPKKPEPPQTERCMVSDTTVEALAPILKANSRGLLLARDELNGWLGSFDRYSGGKGGADASHWLSMYNGETIIVDRRTGQPRTIYVPMAAMCVTGGIQPGILHKALGREHRESGLCARLLLSCPPRKAKRWTEDEIDPELESSVARLIDWLYDLRPAIDDNEQLQPIVIGMKAEAKAAYRDFFESHAQELANLSGELAAAFNKLEETACRLALIVHYARWAAGDESLSHSGPLDRQSMEAGIELCEWFKAEIARVYSILEESPEVRELRQLLEWIEGKGGRLTARELARGPRRYRIEPDRADADLQQLVDGGLGTWADLPSTEQGGRPTRVFCLKNLRAGDETPVKTEKKEGFVATPDISDATEEGEWEG